MSLVSQQKLQRNSRRAKDCRKTVGHRRTHDWSVACAEFSCGARNNETSTVSRPMDGAVCPPQ